ncbi:MAG: sigma-70 family RNA polymerase sigma factor [Proteobacteria bacterium]|nr:sigma-70 family RNA polymerase sigma factor [Pseudomonadota bacterium]
MPTPAELNDWMRAVATTADRAAFAALFRHYAPRVKGFLVRSGTPEGVAEELAQDALATLWRRAASFDPARAQLSTWLYAIARNLAIDQHRRRAGVMHVEGLADDDLDVHITGDARPALSTPDDAAAAAERDRRVRAALNALPPEQAEVLRRSFYDEHAHATIAAELGLPLGTVKSRIRLAVKHLRQLLDDYAP